jgi:hypothetical protein
VSLATLGCTVLGVAAVAHGSGGGYFVYTPGYSVKRTITSTWVTDGEHPYAIWQSKSVRKTGLYRNLANGQVVDVGPMFPAKVYWNTSEIHLEDGQIWVGKYNYFAELNGGPLNKYGGRKICTVGVKGPDFYKLFSPLHGIGSVNSMLCVEMNSNGSSEKIHDVRTDNLALLTETKDGFLYGGPHLKSDEKVSFEQVDSSKYLKYGKYINKVIVYSYIPPNEKSATSRFCLDFSITFIPLSPPAIKIDEKCFRDKGSILDEFGGSYKLSETNDGKADIEIVKPFDSPEITPS